MEQENARRVQHEEQLAEKRLKLDYEDLKTGDTGAAERWEELLTRGREVNTEELRQGVSGVREKYMRKIRVRQYIPDR